MLLFLFLIGDSETINWCVFFRHFSYLLKYRDVLDKEKNVSFVGDVLEWEVFVLFSHCVTQ